MAFGPPDLLIERFMQEHGTDELEALEQFEEVKKFLVVCASDRSRSFAPSKQLDEMWHSFVLFTPDYVRFCKALGGYVHHRPTREVMHQSYRNTLEVMPQIFGDINQEWWRTPLGATCDSMCDGTGCED